MARCTGDSSYLLSAFVSAPNLIIYRATWAYPFGF